VLWAVLDGGFEPQDWGWSGLGLALLLGVAVFSSPSGWWRGERARVVALAVLVASVAWSFASMLWADFPGLAWATSDKALLYAVSFALFAAWPWGAAAAAGALGLYARSG